MKYWLCLAILLGSVAQAETVGCHITYGGETRVIEVAPVATPYTVPTVQIGSYFLFRLVFEERTAIKAYVYGDRDSGPLPLHQATFPYPVLNSGRYGFSGQHFVYEPVRDGELQYWCELRP